MRLLKWVAIGLGIIVVAFLLFLGYVGLVPGMATIFGSNKPKDLGVTYTAQDLQNLRSKLGQQLLELAPGLPPKASHTFSGRVAVNATFTQEELTALLNAGR